MPKQVQTTIHKIINQQALLQQMVKFINWFLKVLEEMRQVRLSQAKLLKSLMFIKKLKGMF